MTGFGQWGVSSSVLGLGGGSQSHLSVLPSGSSGRDPGTDTILYHAVMNASLLICLPKTQVLGTYSPNS
jgi:hypothetical protein